MDFWIGPPGGVIANDVLQRSSETEPDPDKNSAPSALHACSECNAQFPDSIASVYHKRYAHKLCTHPLLTSPHNPASTAPPRPTRFPLHTSTNAFLSYEIWQLSSSPQFPRTMKRQL
ncbi:hypothetical protein K432DRAFT_380126 [Lepidopterella palustris CBS 459.81]|uniref:C2H2-type domain-containing protein n=1 Tax=Lepidopterella palustris CBS 459.81 TaxID=1314670 RepID=A0A8E2EF04_9PEZI|nr:hypothetical protein K432DRAFT_380126 [Lepidopterella palustris CBS 459.81]